MDTGLSEVLVFKLFRTEAATPTVPPPPIVITFDPNTSGAKTAEEAIFAAHLAREALGTNWLKLEIHPDARWLLPDPIETLKAADFCWRDV